MRYIDKKDFSRDAKTISKNIIQNRKKENNPKSMKHIKIFEEIIKPKKIELKETPILTNQRKKKKLSLEVELVIFFIVLFIISLIINH